MNKSATLVIIGIILALVSGVFIWLDQRLVASAVGFTAFFAGLFGSKSSAAKWKVLANLFIASVFGLAMCPKDGFFCMMAMMFLVSFIIGVRLLFFEQLGHARLKYLEPFLIGVVLVYYVFGNLYDGSGWISWALPTPSLAFAAFMVLGKTMEDRELAAGAISAYGVEIGKPAPPFTLPDQDGNPVSLSDFKGKRHVLLIFVRGDWCPTCHIMLRSYEKNKEKFAAKNIMLLAIGPDNIEVNREMVQKLGLDFKLLSDDRLQAVKAYGMQIHSNNPMTKYAEGIPLPASFLVDINGVMQYTSNPQLAGQVLNPETIIPVVEKLHATA
jgi:thioredoxin-dependent peroxiredoxin